NNGGKLPLTKTKTKNEFNIFTPEVSSHHFDVASKDSTLYGGDWDANEEYDPRWPNDYEKIIKERTQNKGKDKVKKEKRKRESTNSQVTATRSLGLDYGDEDDDEYEEERSEEKSKSRASASFAPPAALLENVEKVSSSIGFEVSSVAAKIMVKMGYKEGGGLGKDEQGISKALQVEKTSKSGGKIVYENEASNRKNEEQTITDMLKSPSKVVLLRNMVGPGEVDEELEPETKEECSKYGEVSTCSIYEVDNYESDEDAVRIFIEFVRVESAIKGSFNRFEWQIFWRSYRKSIILRC
ncbi:hypothetical protein RDWZM_001480, partial [Blomia tropicalis]